MSVFFLVNKIDDISGPGAVVAIGIQGENLAQIGKRLAVAVEHRVGIAPEEESLDHAGVFFLLSGIRCQDLDGSLVIFFSKQNFSQGQVGSAEAVAGFSRSLGQDLVIELARGGRMAASLLDVGNVKEDGCGARVLLKSLRKDGLGPGLIPGGKDGSCLLYTSPSPRD